jgi:hypothetical protein
MITKLRKILNGEKLTQNFLCGILEIDYYMGSSGGGACLCLQGSVCERSNLEFIFDK